MLVRSCPPFSSPHWTDRLDLGTVLQPPTELPVSRLLTSFDKPAVFLPPAMIRLADMVAAFVHVWAWPDLVVHSVQNMSYVIVIIKTSVLGATCLL